MNSNLASVVHSLRHWGPMMWYALMDLLAMVALFKVLKYQF
jgi:hypothetical protein